MKIQVVTKQQEGPDTYWARVKGGNDETVWVTETYQDKASAYNAINVLTEGILGVTASAAVMNDNEIVIEEVTESEDG